MTTIAEKLAIVDRLQPYLSDDSMRGRMHADLHDLIEAGEWLVAELDRLGSAPLNSEEVETFFVNLDVHYVQHVTWHLTSLREDIASVLTKIARDDS